jgi:hypothetical protein
MSTIDPSTRWWRSRRLWGTVSTALIIGGVILTVVNGWSVARSMHQPFGGAASWQTPVLAMLPLPMALGGIFIHAFGTRGEDERVGRRLAYPIIALVSGIGVGHTAYNLVHSFPLEIWAVAMVVAGLLAVVILETVLRRTYAKEAVEQEVQRSGVRGRGEITRAVTYYVDYSPVTAAGSGATPGARSEATTAAARPSRSSTRRPVPRCAAGWSSASAEASLYDRP